MTEQDEFRAKILSEMTVDHSDALEKNYALAKNFLRITKEGKVDILVKDKLNGPEKITMYLIGKRYAQRAGLASSEFVKNIELYSELGIVQGSLLPWLKGLRDSNIVIQGAREGAEVTHAVALNAVEKTLKAVGGKLNSERQEDSEDGERTDAREGA